MLPNVKEVHRPTDLKEALRLIRLPGAAIAAGGSRLVAGARDDVLTVVDLGGLKLDYLHTEVDALRLGATSTLQQLVEAPELVDLGNGLLPAAARLTAGRNLRNQATLGGEIATAPSSSPILVVLLALDAHLVIWAPNERTVPLNNFLAYRERLLADGGLITEIAIPRTFAGTGCGWAHVARTPSDLPIVCAAACLVLQDGVCKAVRLGLGGAGPQPLRVSVAEQRLLQRQPTPELLAEVADTAAGAVQPPSDFLGSAEYRKEMVRVLGVRALTEAWERT